MTSKELNLYLIKNLNEIENFYKEEVSWQEGDETGSHVVFGDVFVPFIINIFSQNKFDILKKCFYVIEKMIEFEDDYVDEVIELSIFESLADNNILKNLEIYMGKKTKEKIKKYIN